MKNPYKILSVSRNATAVEIVKGQVLAMTTRKYSPMEIANARKQLSSPEDRLSVDFIYPCHGKEVLSILSSTITHDQYDIDLIDLNAFDSISKM